MLHAGAACVLSWAWVSCINGELMLVLQWLVASTWLCDLLFHAVSCVTRWHRAVSWCAVNDPQCFTCC
jgi:hypothetical protein